MAEQNDVPRAVRLAGLLAAAEGVGVLVAAGALGLSTAVDRPDSYGAALFGVLIGLVAGLLLLRIGRGVARLQAWARAPVFIAQILLVPVGYTLAVSADRPAYGVPILAVCAGVVGLLLTPEARLTFLNR